MKNDFPESNYRNPFLVEAMRNVKMVETEGGGIRKLFVQQRKRFFPMPKYDLTGGKVVCEIIGNVLDENFARILANNPKLTLSEIILLDKVQKHETITKDALALLKKKGYVEGRKKTLFLSYRIASESRHVEMKADYIKNKGFDDAYYKQLITEYIIRYGKASRKEIDTLLWGKLPEVLSDRQKKDKITNLLANLRKLNYIFIGPKREWYLVQEIK